MADLQLAGTLGRALDTNAELAKRAVADLAARCSGLSGPQLEAALKAGYLSLVRRYGNAASLAALEYYMRERGLEGVSEPYDGTMADDAPASYAIADVEEAMEPYKAGRAGYDSIAPNLAGRAVRAAMRQADETIALNAAVDPAHPRWAIVPSSGACGFCIMLGSNGFMYHTRGTADASRHTNCRCGVCVDFSDDPHLDGYDPDALRGLYARAREDIEGDAEEKWAAMTEEERAKYAKYGKRGYDGYLRNRISGEIDSLSGRNSRKRIERYEERLSEARRAYLSSARTKTDYDSTIGSVLDSIGKANGIELSGQYLSGAGLQSSLPSGEELWAITRLSGRITSARFRGEKQGQKNPDYDGDTFVGDIKTVKSQGKVRDRLLSAAMQCRAVPDKLPECALSLVEYSGDLGFVEKAARGFVEDGSLRRVFIIDKRGNAEVIE